MALVMLDVINDFEFPGGERRRHRAADGPPAGSSSIVRGVRRASGTQQPSDPGAALTARAEGWSIPSYTMSRIRLEASVVST
jgi:hypothetical protein